jgi:hypothetical protein
MFNEVIINDLMVQNEKKKCSPHKSHPDSFICHLCHFSSPRIYLGLKVGQDFMITTYLVIVTMCNQVATGLGKALVFLPSA